MAIKILYKCDLLAQVGISREPKLAMLCESLNWQNSYSHKTFHW